MTSKQPSNQGISKYAKALAESIPLWLAFNLNKLRARRDLARIWWLIISAIVSRSKSNTENFHISFHLLLWPSNIDVDLYTFGWALDLPYPKFPPPKMQSPSPSILLPRKTSFSRYFNTWSWHLNCCRKIIMMMWLWDVLVHWTFRRL